MNVKPWVAQHRPAIQDLLLVSLAGAALRVIVYLAYATLAGNDTPGYVKLAHALREWNPGLYDGFRTPGYSLFLLALGINLELVRIAQHVLGVLTAILIYLMARLRVSRRWAVAAGLFYGLSLHFAFYEAIVQTEALANFLMALIFCLYARRTEKSDYSMGSATLIGLLCAYLAMVRPQYLPVFFILAFFDVIRMVRQPRMALRRTLNLFPGAGVLFAAVGGWALLNRILFGSCFLTLFSASAMMQHTIRFGDRAGPEWREAGAILAKWRDYYRAEIEQVGATEIAITPAIREIAALYGTTNIVERYHLLNRINRHLIRQSPIDYAEGVLIGCINFWRVSLIMYPECFKNQRILPAFERLWIPNKLAWLGVHLAFFTSLLAALRRGRTLWKDTLLMSLLAQILLGGMAFQALLTFSNSSRYALPSEGLVLVALLYLTTCRRTANPRLVDSARA